MTIIEYQARRMFSTPPFSARDEDATPTCLIPFGHSCQVSSAEASAFSTKAKDAQHSQLSSTSDDVWRVHRLSHKFCPFRPCHAAMALVMHHWDRFCTLVGAESCAEGLGASESCAVSAKSLNHRGTMLLKPAASSFGFFSSRFTRQVPFSQKRGPCKFTMTRSAREPYS